jgi:hypothetical protein
MATLTVQLPTVAGIVPTYTAAAASDKFVPAGARNHILHVKNGGGSTDNVVINDPTSTNPGSATAYDPDVTVAVAAGAEKVIILHPSRFADSNGEIVYTHSFTTSVTAAVFYVG